MSDDGGKAFPIIDGKLAIFAALSMRDYFAAAALQGALSSGLGTDGVHFGHEFDDEQPDTGSDEFAIIAYRIADAMLKERAK